MIDLKIEDFKPEFSGKMSFYLRALRGIETPVAVARYLTGEMTLTRRPPIELKPTLPELAAGRRPPRRLSVNFALIEEHVQASEAWLRFALRFVCVRKASLDVFSHRR